MTVRPSVLFVRSDSIYKTLDCDAWDEERNALLWPGGSPVVCHPPCRLWGELSHMSTADKSEKWTGIFSVAAVRIWGGCLKHPKRSKLWSECKLPNPKDGVDEHGGFTVAFSQRWFGHLAEKVTWIYVCGVKPKDVPKIPLALGEAEYVISSSSSGKPEFPRETMTRQKFREHTPPALAEWLLDLANRCWKGRRADFR